MNAPYQIFLLTGLLFLLLPLYPDSASGKQASGPSGQMTYPWAEHPVAGECRQTEAWGESIYLLDGEKGIYHYIWSSDWGERAPQLGRFVATDVGVTHCAVMQHALVFIDPAHGIYQLERELESDAEQLWLASTPLHFSPRSFFEFRGDELHLTTGSLSDPVVIETSVRNDLVKALVPSLEIDMPETTPLVGAPTLQPRRLMTFSSAGGVYGVELADWAVSRLPFPNHAALQLGTSGEVRWIEARGSDVGFVSERASTRDIEFRLPRPEGFAGACMAGPHTVLLNHDGTLTRFDWQTREALVEVAAYRLQNGARDCLIDAVTQRLYVVEAGLVIWVFDLSSPGLTMPRAVTTDKVIESLHGLALYQPRRHDQATYLVSQSLGDGAFLVFDTEDMALAARFRIAVNLPAGIDGVLATRGFAAASDAGPLFPRGVLVIQDQRNRLPEEGENFKVIDWRDIEALLAP